MAVRGDLTGTLTGISNGAFVLAVNYWLSPPGHDRVRNRFGSQRVDIDLDITIGFIGLTPKLQHLLDLCPAPLVGQVGAFVPRNRIGADALPERIDRAP